MQRVKFVKTPSERSLGPDDSFEVGKEYDLEDSSAHRWIRRGVAVLVSPKKGSEVKGEPETHSGARTPAGKPA